MDDEGVLQAVLRGAVSRRTWRLLSRLWALSMALYMTTDAGQVAMVRRAQDTAALVMAPINAWAESMVDELTPDVPGVSDPTRTTIEAEPR